MRPDDGSSTIIKDAYEAFGKPARDLLSIRASHDVSALLPTGTWPAHILGCVEVQAEVFRASGVQAWLYVLRAARLQRPVLDKGTELVKHPQGFYVLEKTVYMSSGPELLELAAAIFAKHPDVLLNTKHLRFISRVIDRLVSLAWHAFLW